MAYQVKKTEHSGAKKGRSFYGRKAQAKHESSRVRRKDSEKAVKSGVAESEETNSEE